MKKYLLACTLVATTLSSNAASTLDGEYIINGLSSLKGDFTGRAWVHNGVVQRLVKWKEYTYKNNNIESIWTGTVSSNSFDFTLALSNVITSFESYAPTEAEFKIPVKISLPVTSLSSEFSFDLAEDGTTKERWTRTKDAGNEPLWVDLRKNVLGVGDKHLIVTAISKLAGLYQVIDMYRDLPMMQPYQSRSEFQNANQYFVDDKTDADFYMNNPAILRITNKTINPLSLAEAEMRRNAYGHTLAYKAKFLEDETLKNNLNEAGSLECAIVDDNGNKIGRITENDSALWTSMYGWAEVMRYQTTKDPEALANFKRVLDGVLTLLEIPGDTNQFARTLAISPLEENLGEGWIQGTGKYSHLKWRQGGNNDMAKGIFMTLALAHKVIGNDEVELIQRIKKAAKTLALPTAIAERKFNLGIAKGIDALWNQDEKSFHDFYSRVVNLGTVLGDITGIEAGIYYGGIADWSGIHLTMISNLSQLIVSQELQKVFPGHKAKKAQSSAEAKILDMAHAYKNAHRDFLTLIAYVFSPKAREDQEFSQLAHEALWTLREVPAPRFVGSATADLRKQPNWSMSAWPRLPWKALQGFRKLKDNPNVADLIEGAYAYPNFESIAWSSTYMWKDIPFNIYYGSNKNVKPFSSDYLMLYWASRSAGLLTEAD
ncbi:MAG: hypothetical protein PHY93_11415 [Bacteriovorax sp.]|nr:hypothetical protein [Bacteriovorax sp.]